MSTFKTSREIPASVEQVFAAFSDPERHARWWGPDGFTNTFKLCEFKTGGRLQYVMHGPDGSKYYNESTFLEVSANRVVIKHISEPYYTLTIDLTSLSTDATVVNWSQAFDNPKVAARLEHIVVPANEQNLDRLTAEVLNKTGA